MADDESDYDEAADKFIRYLKKMENEGPVERAGRHSVESESRFATVGALADLAKAVAQISTAQGDLVRAQTESRQVLNEVRDDTKEMRGWLIGRPSALGTPQPGIMQKVAVLDRAWKWALGLVGIIAIDSVLNTVHTLFGK